MHHKISSLAPHHIPGGRRPAADPPPRPILLNPPPAEVRAQCAKDNERRMRLHDAALFARRNHCD
jgi:hypothetical protein